MEGDGLPKQNRITTRKSIAVVLVSSYIHSLAFSCDVCQADSRG